MTAKILYFADPMCSWCYGFASQISEVKSNFPDIDFQLVMGGLRPFGRETIVDMRESLKHHWDEVHARSGQEFSHDILEQTDFVYDTEPPSRAVVAMRSLKPEMEFTFFKAVQAAFYRDNADTNQLETYRKLAREYDVEEQDFADAFNSPTIKKQTLQDFHFARQLGVTAFPTTVLQQGEKYFLLANGYTEAQQILAAMEKMLPAEKN